MKMKNSTKGRIIEAVAIAVDVVPMLIATMTQFPIWVQRSSEATVSGLFVMFALLSVVPLFRKIKAALKSPSIWVILTILSALMICIRRIIDEMIIILIVGAICNFVGAIIYKHGNAIKETKETVTHDREDTDE